MYWRIAHSACEDILLHIFLRELDNGRRSDRFLELLSCEFFLPAVEEGSAWDACCHRSLAVTAVLRHGVAIERVHHSLNDLK